MRVAILMQRAYQGVTEQCIEYGKGSWSGDYTAESGILCGIQDNPLPHVLIAANLI